MPAMSIVELSRLSNPDRADATQKTLDGKGSHLFGLRCGIGRQTGDRRRQENLKRLDPGGVAGQRHDRHDSAVQPSAS